MNHRNKSTGQQIDSREHNDNAPVRYYSPSADFKEILASYANPYCRRCGGSGYIGVFKHVCAGRCFKCIPEAVWGRAQGEFDQTCEARTGCDEMVEIDRLFGPFTETPQPDCVDDSPCLGTPSTALRPVFGH